MSREQVARELLRRAWRILDIDAPNDKTTEDIAVFLAQPAEPVPVVPHALEATPVVSNETAIHETQAEPVAVAQGVERFDFTEGGFEDASERGHYVRYADHARIVAEMQADRDFYFRQAGDLSKQVNDVFDRAEAAESTLRALQARVEATCDWTLDDNPYASIWESACGESWSFTEGGPEDNNVRFCHGCGQRVRLLAVPAGEEANG